MNCKKCGYKMIMLYNVEFPLDFIIYRCSKCDHEHKFSQEDILIAVLEFVKEEC